MVVYKLVSYMVVYYLVYSVAKLVCSLDDYHMDYLAVRVAVVGIGVSLELDSKDCMVSFH